MYSSLSIQQPAMENLDGGIISKTNDLLALKVLKPSVCGVVGLVRFSVHRRWAGLNPTIKFAIVPESLIYVCMLDWRNIDKDIGSAKG